MLENMPVRVTVGNAMLEAASTKLPTAQKKKKIGGCSVVFCPAEKKNLPLVYCFVQKVGGEKGERTTQTEQQKEYIALCRAHGGSRSSSSARSR
jgi:hypothetical protein